LFGNTYSLFDKTLRAFGIETRFVDLENLEEISQHIDQNTRCLFLEMVTNPQLIVYDVEQIAELAKQKNIPLVVDNSVLTPYLFDVKPYPVDVEVISTTKFISGGATSVGGCVLSYDTGKWDKVPKLEKAFNQFGKEAFAKLMRKEVFRNTGCCQSPNNAYLQLLGLETLPLRVDRIMKNTLETAKYLEQLEKIVSVHYPCLKSSPYHDLAAKYLPNGAGSLINLELDSKEACYQFMDALQMIRRGTNFCDNKSMIIHPGSTIFCEYNQEEKANMRVNDGMLRLSVGLEDIDDIRDDIERGLKNV
jgi:O-acetylhomoserine (thiol)-lyase